MKRCFPVFRARPLAILSALAVFLAGCGGEPPAKLNSGDAAPAFRAALLDGGTVEFPAAYAGKPVVLRFWADWCKFCEGEMKMIDAVRRDHAAAGLAVLAVNAGQDRTTAAAFMAKLGVGYAAALDESSAVAKRYGVVGLPTTYLVDARGVVRGKIVGEADAAMFERHVQALLK